MSHQPNRITLAHLAVDGEAIATSVENATAATNLEWVEINGHRFENVVEATISLADQVNVVTVTFFGVIELVALTEGDLA